MGRPHSAVEAKRVEYLRAKIARMERWLAELYFSDSDRHWTERYLVELRADYWLAILDHNQTKPNEDVAA